jgi:hypothetical protein
MEIRVVLESAAELIAEIGLGEPPAIRHLDVAGHDVVAGFSAVVVTLAPRREIGAAAPPTPPTPPTEGGQPC